MTTMGITRVERVTAGVMAETDTYEFERHVEFLGEGASGDGHVDGGKLGCVL